MKKLLLVFFCLPFFASADIKYVVKPFETPSGFVHWALVQVIGPIHVSASELTLKEQIQQYIKTMADWHDTDREFMLFLAGCESGYRTDIYGDKGKSYGLYQWQIRSWAHYNKVYKTELNRLIWQDQTKMTARVLADGGWRNWYNCRKFFETGAYVDYS